MQNDAIKYAREMQKRAADFNSTKDKISDINHIYTNKESHYEKKSTDRFNNNFRNNPDIKNIFSSNTQHKTDNDISLILALILILSVDSGDRMLIMALLYIMT